MYGIGCPLKINEKKVFLMFSFFFVFVKQTRALIRLSGVLHHRIPDQIKIQSQSLTFMTND